MLTPSHTHLSSPSLAELHSLMELLPQAAYLLDGEGRITYVNPAAEALFGWTPAQLLQHQLHELALFPETFRSSILARLRATGSWEGTGERYGPDGSTRSVRARWRMLVTDENGNRYAAVEQDVTEHRLREQELQQARKLAKIGVLSEGIAHELRNPLSYALSAAQLLEDERITADVRLQCVQTITTGLRKAGLIVNNLLSLGKPQSPFTRARVLLADVLQEAIDAAGTHENRPAVEIDVDLPPHGLPVEGNSDMLVQVLHNVITNALNELPDGGSIEVSGEEVEQGLVLRIRDSGPGVSEEEMRHLFDPFYTASRSGRGTGLGLTLSYYIMKEHGGSIEVESRPGHGASFLLQFPRVAAG
ncbi:MAG: ATP-binding protein [Bacteroidota bacterium]|nr:ATP-binding protein [Bacteroidota bacterium]